MRITRVEVYGYDLSYVHGEYVMSGGRAVSRLPSTVVRILTDEGGEGYGEVCPLGPTYLPSFAEGARAALRVLAPALIGADPLNLAAAGERLDGAPFMNDWVNEHIAGYQPRSRGGVGAPPARPGLGIDVEWARLGAPLFATP